ncbi:MAG: membrane protein [Phycisphaerae bacterium]
MIVTLLFVVFFVLLLLEVPISVALVLASVAGIAAAPDVTQHLVPRRMFAASNAFPLLAIPFFVMAGGIMGRGGMSKRLIALASSLVGNIRGGFAITSVLACMLFAAISGSTAATTAAIGAIMIPAIVESGFSRPSATSLQATAGSIGIIIPPSIPMVLMGWIGGMSIGRLFLAGVVPGMLLGLGLAAVCYFTAVAQRHATSGHAFSPFEFLVRLKQAALPLLAVVLVIGGIMFGWVTATEAGVVAVFYALFVSMAVYRELAWHQLGPILVDTAKITGIVVLCIAAASPFAWMLTVDQVPLRVSEGLLTATQNAIVIKLVMIAILLVIGTFLDLTPAMLIFVPIFLPIARQIGMNDVHFGAVVVCALGIGQCTPPVGIALFVACSVAGTRMDQLFRPLFPYLAAMIAALLITAFWEEAVLALPNWFIPEQ